MRPTRLILEATIDEAVIHGTLTGPPGEQRLFYGWLEFNTAVEAALSAGRSAEAAIADERDQRQ